jgi:hypothetical protein
MLLFEIIDFFFKLPFPSSLDLSFNNLNPIVETNTKLLLTTITFHDLQLQNCLLVITRIKVLGEAKEHHVVFSVFINKI